MELSPTADGDKTLDALRSMPLMAPEDVKVDPDLRFDHAAAEAKAPKPTGGNVHRLDLPYFYLRDVEGEEEVVAGDRTAGDTTPATASDNKHGDGDMEQDQQASETMADEAAKPAQKETFTGAAPTVAPKKRKSLSKDAKQIKQNAIVQVNLDLATAVLS